MEGRTSPRRAAAIRATLRQVVEGSDTLSLDSPCDRGVLLRRLERALDVEDPALADVAAEDEGTEEGPGSWRFELERDDSDEGDL